jgi:hypothetical protein
VRGRPRLLLEPVYAPEIDWAQVMIDLYDRGCNAHRVSIILGVSPCTSRNWMKGGEPGYGNGRALLRLHSRMCGSALTIARCEEAETA